jgi:hypothetical protein
LPGAGAEAVHDALVALDDDDLIRVRAGGSTSPIRSRVRLRRFACVYQVPASASPVARPTRSASRR